MKVLTCRHRSCSQPGNYVRTVHRTEKSFQACNDIVACFTERAKVEKQYAQQLSQWSSKWKSIVDSREYEKRRDGGAPKTSLRSSPAAHRVL